MVARSRVVDPIDEVARQYPALLGVFQQEVLPFGYIRVYPEKKTRM
jgi:hypothetical protein